MDQHTYCERKEEKGLERIFAEITVGNFPNFMKHGYKHLRISMNSKQRDLK
jgi:hypothetical protein